jgi:hypothetical protein
MTITNVSAVPVGNAMRVYLTPPAGAAYWSLLRRTDADFTVVNDPEAVTIAANTDSKIILDYTGLENGTEYFYCDFAWVAGAYVMGTPVAGTPAAAYQSDTVDPLTFVRDRLRMALANEIAWGNLKPSTGKIQVLTAPYALLEGVSFPVVSVHLDDDSPGIRAIGEMNEPPAFDITTGAWIDSEGWLASVRLNIVGASLNGDERIELRKAIKRAIQANLTVFTAVGFVNINFSQQDGESLMGEKETLLYNTNGTFMCDAPSRVIFTEPNIITGVSVTVDETTLESAYV